jgi:hypothetical protein
MWGWDAARNKDGREERTNPDTGVVEEKSMWGWDAARNKDGREERTNPDTGVVEEKSMWGWEASKRSGRRPIGFPDKSSTSGSEQPLDASGPSYKPESSTSSSYSYGNNPCGSSSSSNSGVGVGIILVLGVLVVALIASSSLSPNGVQPVSMVSPVPQPETAPASPREMPPQTIDSIAKSVSAGPGPSMASAQPELPKQPAIRATPFARGRTGIDLYVNGPTVIWSDGSVDVWGDNNSRHVLLPANSRLSFPSSRVIHVVRTSPETTTLYSEAIVGTAVPPLASPATQRPSSTWSSPTHNWTPRSIPDAPRVPDAPTFR